MNCVRVCEMWFAWLMPLKCAFLMAPYSKTKQNKSIVFLYVFNLIVIYFDRPVVTIVAITIPWRSLCVSLACSLSLTHSFVVLYSNLICCVLQIQTRLMKHYMTSNKISKIISVIWSKSLPTWIESVKHWNYSREGKRNKRNLFKAKSFSVSFTRNIFCFFSITSTFVFALALQSNEYKYIVSLV